MKTSVLAFLPALLSLGALACSGQSSPSQLRLSPAAIEHLQGGAAALHANHPEEAVLDFRQLTQEAPRFAEGYLNLGLALGQIAHDEDAVQALEKGIALKPAMRGAHLFLAISEYRLGRLGPAGEAIRKETGAYKTDAQAWMWQGIIDLAQARLTVAVEDLDRAADLDSKNVDILYHRGRAALALSRQSYETMFQIDPKSWHVAQVLAEADVESGNDADAITQWQRAIAAAPPEGGLYEALGSSYWRAGKYTEAQQAYETALKMDPNDTLTMYKLGCLLIDRSDAADGKPLLDRVLLADPSLTMTTYYLGRAELQLGHDQAAIEDFRQTIDRNLDDETTKQAYFQLSRAYRRQHNVTASAEAQAQYRLLDEKSKDALQAKLKQRSQRADRDTSIPAPAQDPTPPQP